MNETVITSFRPSADLGPTWSVVAGGVAAVALLLLAVELWRRPRAPGLWLSLATGILSIGALLLAVLRPAKVFERGVLGGPRVVVLVDGSHSMNLPSKGEPRHVGAERAVAHLLETSKGSQVSVLRFGEGTARAVEPGAPYDVLASDLDDALLGLVAEPPSAVVVISDGRLSRPSALAEVRTVLPNVRVHTVGVAEEVPRDASIRAIQLAGSAVAHQPFTLSVTVGCSTNLVCDDVTVRVRELYDRERSKVLSEGVVHLDGVSDEGATVALTANLHRAGPRVLEVSIDAPAGDTIDENNRRFLTLDVARDRIRVLHIAGRPTYDVRALRNWLKADASVDVVAFFILRSLSEDTGAPPSELSLIPFPVDELFTVHLPSFDAIVLQDFNAETYGLTKHLTNLREYIRAGGGLIMVGGPDAFGPGKYAGTPIADALPVRLKRGAEGVDAAWFRPVLTDAGRSAPVLAPLRDVTGGRLPEFPGTNLVEGPSPGATVLWTHPDHEGAPVLALGEFGSGRTIALTIDGAHRFQFSEEAADQHGRAYGALWDGLLGWLMRDPKFESTRVAFSKPCVAGIGTDVLVTPLSGQSGDVELTVHSLGAWTTVHSETRPAVGGQTQRFTLPALPPGGYTASVRILVAGGASDVLVPANRVDFGCEAGGDEWADTRPNDALLEAIAKRGGGMFAKGELDLPATDGVVVASERRAEPLGPPWALTTIAAALTGVHWLTRRRRGLS